MKKLMLPFAALAAIALIFAGTLTADEAPAKATVGEAAPDFTLPSHTGEEVSLSDYEGKIVVLEWINDGCPFVVKFYRPGKMQELQKQYREQEVVWLLVASSSPGTQGYHTAEGWQKIAEDWNIEADHILLDPEGTVGRSYGATNTPHMYVITDEGTLAYAGAIDSIRSANSADIERADNYVVNALTQLMAGEEVTTSETRAYGCDVKYAN